jgi:hypothetical protein
MLDRADPHALVSKRGTARGVQHVVRLRRDYHTAGLETASGVRFCRVDDNPARRAGVNTDAFQQERVRESLLMQCSLFTFQLRQTLLQGAYTFDVLR